MHDIKLKMVRNDNKLMFDLDCEFDNGDTVDCRLQMRCKSPERQAILDATENLINEKLSGGEMKVKVATDLEVAEVFSTLIDICRAQNDLVKASL